LLLIAISGTDWFVRAVFCNKALMGLGLIAYAAYLFHRFAIRVAQLGIGSVWTSQSFEFFAGAMLVGVVGAILAAQLSWTWFEKPLVRRGHHYRY
jgi:peptidoglycan/LPS O-acetylase OafA/YrhL